jgi:hypothetical protein
MVQSKVKSMSKSRYDRRPVNQYVMVPSPLGIKGVPSERFQFYVRRCTLRWKFWCYHWEGCMRSILCNVEFGYQLNICSATKENYGKPWSSWPVAGPSGCKLTSSHRNVTTAVTLEEAPDNTVQDNCTQKWEIFPSTNDNYWQICNTATHWKWSIKFDNKVLEWLVFC